MAISSIGAFDLANRAVKSIMALIRSKDGELQEPALAFRDQGYHVDTIVSQHALIHEGMTYSAGYAARNVAAGSSIEVTFLCGANYSPHVALFATSEGDATVYIYENRTVTGGTALTPRNKNRGLTTDAAGNAVTISTIDALCQETLKHSPATSSGGTLLQQSMLVSSGAGGNTSVAAIGGRDEWNFCPSIQYTIIVTNDDASAKDLVIALEWYEHPRNTAQTPEVLT